MKPIYSISLIIALFFGLAFQSCETPEPEVERPDYVLVIHGGAGTISPDVITPEQEEEYKSKLNEALEAGEAILKNGGTSIEAVEAAIIIMEDSPLFNAGRGAVFTNQLRCELDASVMEGATLNAGAVAGVTDVKNPIKAAIAVMERSPHVMMAGSGASVFAKEQGLEIVENEYFHTQRRLDAVKRAIEEAQQDNSGTVGAAALDTHGNLAAGTSTGGMTNKMYGRIGDSPIIGAGTYANNESCAVSATGHGEYFIRHTVASDISARMLYMGERFEDAANYVVNEKLVNVGATGGVIGVDKNGNVAMPFNTPGMYRGYVKSTGEKEIAIFKDE